MNLHCWEHDNCYPRECVKDACQFFSPQGALSSCDLTFNLGACSLCASADWKSAAICAISRTISVYWLREAGPLSVFLPQCFEPPCPDGQVCNSPDELASEGVCGPTPAPPATPTPTPVPTAEPSPVPSCSILTDDIPLYGNPLSADLPRELDIAVDGRTGFYSGQFVVAGMAHSISGGLRLRGSPSFSRIRCAGCGCVRCVCAPCSEERCREVSIRLAGYRLGFYDWDVSGTVGSDQVTRGTCRLTSNTGDFFITCTLMGAGGQTLSYLIGDRINWSAIHSDAFCNCTPES